MTYRILVLVICEITPDITHEAYIYMDAWVEVFADGIYFDSYQSR